MLKTHIFVPRLLARVDVVLSSHRDVRDVVLSSMLMFGACFAPTGATRTQRAHGVALRFQQYAHWAPYVCYDGKYERMKANYTAEVERLAAVALRGFPDASVDAGAVVDAVDALSRAKPSKCAVGKHQGRGSKPRECWDAKSGFAAKHVHAATSAPRAYAKKVVLDEVQRRVPRCDVFLALRRVTEGFGGWLAAHGYDDGADGLEERDAAAELALRDASLEVVNTTDADGDDAPARRRRLLAAPRAARPRWGNAFVDSLPERDAVMDASGAPPTGGTPVGFPRFVHVVNRAGQESDIPNFKGSYLGRFPLVSADFWTSDHLSERPRSVDAFSGTGARGTLTLKRR